MFAMQLSATSLFSQAKIEIEGGTQFDLGVITKSYDLVALPVYIKNIGTDTLKIFDAEPSCNCMKAPLEKNFALPGECVKMNVLLRTDINLGENNHIINVYSNDSLQPITGVVIKSFLTDVIKLSENYLFFDNLQAGQKSTAEISIENNTLFNIQLFNFKTEPAELKINLQGRTVIKPESSIKLIAEYTPAMDGFFQGYIHFKTDQWNAENLKICVIGRSKH